MSTVIILGCVAFYLAMAVVIIRWAQDGSDVERSKVFDIVGVMLIPPLAGRATKWIIPDAWNWPESAIGMAVGAAVMLVLFFAYFNLRVLQAVLAFLGVYACAMVPAVAYILLTPTK